MGSPAIPPPPAPDPNDVTPQLGPASQGSGSGMDRFRAIITHLSGGGTPAIQERLAADFAKRQQDAETFRNQAKQATIYATHANATVGPNAPFGINPVTGQPATAQDVQKWHNDIDTGTQGYLKTLPKDAKPIAQKLFEVTEHAIGRKGKTGAPAGQSSAPLPQAQQAGPGGSNIPPPPQGAPQGASVGPAIPPPPNQPPPAAAQSASQNPMELPANMQPAVLGAPEQQRMMGVQNELATSKQAQEQSAAVGLEASKKARLAEPEIAAAELDKVAPNMPPEQKQNLLVRKLGYVPPPKMVTKIMSDPDSPTGASQVSYDQLTGTVYTRQQGAFMPRGYIPTETITKDPYGNVSVSTRTPVAPGVSTGGKPATGGGKAKAGAPVGGGGVGGTGAGGGSRSTAAPPPLDAEGHINGVPHGYTPQSVEGANRLLDGAPTSDLPTASRALSGQLARQYGWEQGKFTPKEQTQIREASTFIQQALTDQNALSALDGDTIDRAKLSQVLANPDKEGFIGRTLTGAAAASMDDRQTAFVQMYNQLVGTIAGLSKLVRPGGTTEAQIERLKSELPNPVTTKNSADARQRLQRLQKEIDIARAKGNFGELGAVSTPAKSAARPGAVPPPPTGARKQFYRLGGKFYDAVTRQEIPAQGAQ